MRKLPLQVKVIAKGVGIFFLLLTVTSMAGMAFNAVTEDVIDRIDASGYVSRCDTYYYEKEYYRLWDILELYDLNDDIYDVYWESVEGHKDYIQYLQWKKAADMGDEGSMEKVAYYKDVLEENLENCQFEKNEKQFRRYLEE